MSREQLEIDNLVLLTNGIIYLGLLDTNYRRLPQKADFVGFIKYPQYHTSPRILELYPTTTPPRTSWITKGKKDRAASDAKIGKGRREEEKILEEVTNTTLGTRGKKAIQHTIGWREEEMIECLGMSRI